MTLTKKTWTSLQEVRAGMHKVRVLNNIVGKIELVEVAVDAWSVLQVHCTVRSVSIELQRP